MNEFIEKLSVVYALNSGEKYRLLSVLKDFEEQEHQNEIIEETKNILASRLLNVLEPLTRETIDRARENIESSMNDLLKDCTIPLKEKI